MHLRCVTNITIHQNPTKEHPFRDTTLNFDFCHEWTATDSWMDFTNEAKIVVPKALYYIDDYGKRQPLKGTNINFGGFSGETPLVLRGDRVQIIGGYKYYDKKGNEIEDTSIIFDGYVSKVGSKQPLTFDCEDNFWKLKQLPAPTKTFKETDTLENIAKELLKGTSFTVNALTSTTLGAFSVGNETVAQVFARLRKDYHFEAYFQGNELRVGSKIYVEDDAKEHRFRFQYNIIEDALEYKRLDDLTLSAIAYNTVTEDSGSTTKDGQSKTKQKRIAVLVTLKGNQSEPTYHVITKDSLAPANDEGERRTLFFPGAKNVEDLKGLALAELRKYFYAGLKGTFTTFGVPFVKMGDNVTLEDPILPERNGKYKVKAVNYAGGINGMRQVITLDYLIKT